MPVHACTIIARNYLPRARVLAASFSEHHPGGSFTVLLIDDVHREVDAGAEPFAVLRPIDIGLSAAEFHNMAMIYEIVELATAMKPWLIRHLLSTDVAAVVYLDPDIRIYSALNDVITLAEKHGIVLTPHVTAPMPRDGKMTHETAILAAGIYNLGFIVIGRRAQPFLDFWMERLYRECIIDPHNMRFVDQRWIDFVPGIFDCHILRDPSYNVAYWNLDHRELGFTEQGYQVGGLPLRFFHFSGFDVNAPSLLSKHQGSLPRVLLSERPSVARICAEYAAALRASTRQGEAGTSYGFAALPQGVPLDPCVRLLFRRRLVGADVRGVETPPDPFTPEGAEELVAWLNSPPEERRRVTRYLAQVHTHRLDLQAAYPDPEGGDYDAYFNWAHHEVSAGRLHPLLVPLSRRPAQPAPVDVRWAPAGGLTPGVCVAGYLRAELGMGQLGRLALAAVQEAGIEAGSFVIEDGILSRQAHPFEQARAANLNVNVVAVNADQFVHFATRMGSPFFDGRYTIGLWAWELEEFPPEWAAAFAHVDEIWAISDFERHSIAAATEKPVFTFPLAVVAPPPRPNPDRASMGLPEGFLFLFCFDYLSVAERKNPIGLIQAFTRAFTPEEGPKLVIKATNGEHRLAKSEELKLFAADRPDVIVVDRYLDHDHVAALMKACDCYVSLHRSEGFGLTMAEALALGKPVIATAYSGNLDFMDDRTAYLVPWTEGSVPKDCPPYRAGARWAEPDLDAAARLMRRVVENPDETASIGRQAQQTMLLERSLGASADFIRSRFQYAQAVISARSGGGSAGKNSDPLREEAVGVANGAAREPSRPIVSLLQLARSRASITSDSRRPLVSRPLRRIMARLTAHSDAHRAEVDAALAEHLVELEATVTGIDRRLGTTSALEAQTSISVARLDARLRLLAESLGSRFDGVMALLGTIVGRLDHVESTGPRVDQLTALLSTIVGRLDHVENTGPRVDQLTALLSTIVGRLDQFEPELKQIDGELHAAPFMSDVSLLQTTDSYGRPAIGYEGLNPPLGTNVYVAFEDIFRGPQDFIRDRMTPYLDLVRAHQPILDMGCGRGEFLDLLSGDGIQALGVDIDPGMVDVCLAKGHQAAVADALEYLSVLEGGSIGTIFSAQFIEHLSPDALIEYLSVSQRVLRGGGVFIAETVNPHSVQAFKTFWTDLTHRAPIFPEVAVALCRSAGFERAIVMFPHGNGDLDQDRRSNGEYAVVARKRVPTTRDDALQDATDLRAAQ